MIVLSMTVQAPSKLFLPSLYFEISLIRSLVDSLSLDAASFSTRTTRSNVALKWSRLAVVSRPSKGSKRRGPDLDFRRRHTSPVRTTPWVGCGTLRRLPASQRALESFHRVSAPCIPMAWFLRTQVPRTNEASHGATQKPNQTARHGLLRSWTEFGSRTRSTGPPLATSLLAAAGARLSSMESSASVVAHSRAQVTKATSLLVQSPLCPGHEGASPVSANSPPVRRWDPCPGSGFVPDLIWAPWKQTSLVLHILFHIDMSWTWPNAGWTWAPLPIMGVAMLLTRASFRPCASRSPWSRLNRAGLRSCSRNRMDPVNLMFGANSLCRSRACSRARGRLQVAGV